MLRTLPSTCPNDVVTARHAPSRQGQASSRAVGDSLPLRPHVEVGTCSHARTNSTVDAGKRRAPPCRPAGTSSSIDDVTVRALYARVGDGYLDAPLKTQRWTAQLQHTSSVYAAIGPPVLALRL